MDNLKTLSHSVLALLLVLLPFSAFCKKDQLNLSVSAIPAKLKENAHAVIRYDSTFVDIISRSELRYIRKYAITVLDEEGCSFGYLQEGYNKLVSITAIQGHLYDANGKLIQKLKKKDVMDRSTFGMDYTFNSDSRIKSYRFAYPSFPYTVEYEIRETIKSTFSLPDWTPQKSPKCSIEKAFLSLSYPASTIVREKEYLMPAQTDRNNREIDGIIFKTWTIGGLSSFEPQPFSMAGNFNMPTIILAANDFELMGHNGSMDSWKSFGLFNYELNQGRDSLPLAAKNLIHSLIKDDTSTLQKVQDLYAYMQKNTRYVADEYGISGWQTFDANSVCTKGYGDCKGLTNYLKAMLKEAGITAYPSLVNAGKDDYYRIDPKFPANTFNHVILCIPDSRDTIWVECTSQQLPAGYLGGFTQNRFVLLTTEQGGYLIKTPSYEKDKNYLNRQVKIVYDNKADAQLIALQNEYSCLMQDDMLYLLKTLPEDKKQKWINQKFNFPSYEVVNYNYQFSGTNKSPLILENAKAKVNGFIQKSNKRTFINLGWLPNPMEKIIQTTPRTKPIVLEKDFRITDSIILVLPPDVTIESVPGNTELQFPFATFTQQVQKQGNQVLLTSKYEQNAGIYGKDDFDDYQKMYRAINAEKENLNVVLSTSIKMNQDH